MGWTSYCCGGLLAMLRFSAPTPGMLFAVPAMAAFSCACNAAICALSTVRWLQSRLVEPPPPWQSAAMSTLAEIEAAAEALPAEEKQELLLFLATRLRAERARSPEPRKFTREQMAAWIAEDEEDMRRLREEA